MRTSRKENRNRRVLDFRNSRSLSARRKLRQRAPAMQAAAAGGSTGAITRGASESTLHTLRAPPGPPLPRVLPEVPAVAAWQSPGGHHSEHVLRAAQRHFTPIQRR